MDEYSNEWTPCVGICENMYVMTNIILNVHYIGMVYYYK
jgi:hypothetical protein